MVLPPASKEHRVLLAGKGEKILDLVLRQAPSKQWAQWLRLPLSVAAAEGDLTCVTELLAAGADGSAGQRNLDGSTLLHEAAKGGNEKVKQKNSGVIYTEYTGSTSYCIGFTFREQTFN